MIFAVRLLAVVAVSTLISASHAEVRITDDYGGRIGTYLDKYRGLRISGEKVVIDGMCASACTMVLSSVPQDRICVTSRAVLGFHVAWDANAYGREVTNREATRALYSMYPAQVRHWIAANGGLKQQMIFLRGKQLTNMYRPCVLDARASAEH